jgi:hypothetical protein
LCAKYVANKHVLIHFRFHAEPETVGPDFIDTWKSFVSNDDTDLGLSFSEIDGDGLAFRASSALGRIRQKCTFRIDAFEDGDLSKLYADFTREKNARVSDFFGF